MRRLFPVVALGCGLVAALAAGEALTRVTAWLSPQVQYLATAGTEPPTRSFDTLEAYLASQAAQVVPHRNWLNYWTNALGFNDEEFTVPKPAGRFRIMALGDSFTFGLLPYPYTVMTLLESSLRTACPGKDLDLLNFGIGGAGVHDYRTIVSLAFATYEPDLVLVNFYAGNDGPDLYRLVHEGRSSLRSFFDHSRLWTLGRNVVKLRKSLAASGAGAARPALPAPGGPPPRGGTAVDPGRPIREDDPSLGAPTPKASAFDSIMAIELRRLYVPRDPAVADEAWRPVLAALDAIRAQVTQGGSRLAIVLYPSALQVYPAMREDLAPRLRRRARYAPLSLDAIDPWLPNKRLADYCRTAGLPCFDVTPALLEASRGSSEVLYRYRDTHWTFRGNRIAAEAEAAHLADLVCPSGPAARPRPSLTTTPDRPGRPPGA
jgi:SGNH hydrolase-like domain, acetyltransferase AlgX